MEKNENAARMPQKYQWIIAIVVPAIVFPVMYLAFLSIPRLVDLRRLSFFRAYLIMLAIPLSLILLPVAIFGEYLNKEWKRRKFLWKSVLFGFGLFGIFACVAFTLLALLDVFLSYLDLIWQVPLAAIATSVGLIVLALVARSKRFKIIAKTRFGW